MYGCENWTIKKALHQRIDVWIVVLEKTLESPLDSSEIKPVNSKGNQSWIFTGRTDAEAETPILWLSDVKSGLIGKDPDSGKDWRQEEKGETREWDVWMASLSQWTWVERAAEMVKDRETWRAAVHWVQKVRHNLAIAREPPVAPSGRLGEARMCSAVLCSSCPCDRPVLDEIFPSAWLLFVGLRVTIPHKALLLTSCGHTLWVRKTNLKCFQSLRV